MLVVRATATLMDINHRCGSAASNAAGGTGRRPQQPAPLRYAWCVSSTHTRGPLVAHLYSTATLQGHPGDLQPLQLYSAHACGVDACHLIQTLASQALHMQAGAAAGRHHRLDTQGLQVWALDGGGPYVERQAAAAGADEGGRGACLLPALPQGRRCLTRHACGGAARAQLMLLLSMHCMEEQKQIHMPGLCGTT